jgi:alkylhydroperoxidase family enzyme
MPEREPLLPPKPEAEWDDRTREILSATANPVSGTLNIFATLAHHPLLMRRWLAFGGHVLSTNTLPPRQRELVILRVGWLCGSQYEWGQHVVIARREGITDEEIAAVASGPDAANWDPLEALLLRAVAELHESRTLSERTWRALADHYDEQQMLDLVFTVGQYELVSMVLNSCRVERDDGVDESTVPFPDQVSR